MDHREMILLQNARFYEALETCDMTEIDAVWSHAPYVRYIHPGWVALEGWDTVRHGLHNIMQGNWQISVSLRNVTVKLFGNLAVVVLTEEIVSHAMQDVTMVTATNIFEYDGRGWKMIHHHGSPLSVPELEEDGDTFRYN